mgnify:FL=1
MCAEWLNYWPFYNWAISNGYSNGLTIDRIDNDRGYSPENCKWSTPKEQANNRRSSRLVVALGETKTVAQWADDLGINQDRIYNRLHRGWSEERALTTPIVEKHNQSPVVDNYGKFYDSISQAAEINGVSRSLVSMVCAGRRRSANGKCFSYATSKWRGLRKED